MSTYATERDKRDAQYFKDGWMAALREVRLRGDRAVGKFLVEQLGDDEPESTLPTEPGTVITWRDGAYLPQLAQLDPGEMRLGWRYTDDTGGYWLTPGEMLAQIGDVEYTVLGVSA